MKRARYQRMNRRIISVRVRAKRTLTTSESFKEISLVQDALFNADLLSYALFYLIQPIMENKPVVLSIPNGTSNFAFRHFDNKKMLPKNACQN